MRKPDPSELPPESPGEGAGAGPTSERSLEELLDSLKEHGSRAWHELVRSLRLRGDLARERVEHALTRLVLAAGLGLATAAGLATAVVLLLVGAAQGLAAAMDAPGWVGALTVAGITFLLAGALTSLLLARRRKQRREHYERKYAEPRGVPAGADAPLPRPLGR